MANFNIAFQKTLIHEGGYSNDPDDRGGETYKGIARNIHSNWSGWKRIDRYKNKSGFPFALDKDTELQKMIEQFYYTNFWMSLQVEKIENQSIADSIFDFGVNAGIKTSVRLVQSVVEVKVDGIIGTQTLEKLNAVNANSFLSAFTLRKITYYIAIIKKRPASKKFLYGWIIRSLTFSHTINY